MGDQTDTEPTAEALLAAGDNIGALCKLVKDAGLTMTLYGQPVSGPDELRAKALDSAASRIATTFVDAELEAIQRRALVLEHVRADRAAGSSWCCACPWCAATRRSIALAAANGATEVRRG